MWDNSKDLEKALKDLERLKVSIMNQFNRLNANKDTIIPTTVYPMANVQPMVINDYPVFQFSYEGTLPHFKEKDKEYNIMIKDYYIRSTIGAYDFNEIGYRFKESVIIFAQYFKDEIVRDLENHNKKYIQDAIRSTGLVGDDNWKRVWNMDMGFKDEERNHVQVYVVSRENYIDFYAYLLENHEELKEFNVNTITKEQSFLDYKAREKHEKEAQKNTHKKTDEIDSFFSY